MFYLLGSTGAGSAVTDFWCFYQIFCCFYLKSNLSMMQNGKSNGQNSKTRSLLMFLPILSPFRLTKPAEWHTKRRIQCTKQQNHITFAVFTDIFDVLTVRTGWQCEPAAWDKTANPTVGTAKPDRFWRFYRYFRRSDSQNRPNGIQNGKSTAQNSKTNVLRIVFCCLWQWIRRSDR